MREQLKFSSVHSRVIHNFLYEQVVPSTSMLLPGFQAQRVCQLAHEFHFVGVCFETFEEHVDRTYGSLHSFGHGTHGTRTTGGGRVFGPKTGKIKKRRPCD